MNYFEYETINVEYYKSPLYSIFLFIDELTCARIDFIIYNWEQTRLLMPGSINKRLMLSAYLCSEYGRNSITKKILTDTNIINWVGGTNLCSRFYTRQWRPRWHETSSSGGKTSPDHSPYAVTASRQWWQEFSILVIIRKQGQGCSHIGCSF